MQMRRAPSCRDLPPAARKLLITDGVFSMDGDLGALPALCGLAEEYGCIMMVDDAHAPAVYLAPTAAARSIHFGLHGRVDVQVGTLSKGDWRARRIRVPGAGA
jgi:glycine C-acetyltransferase